LRWGTAFHQAADTIFDCPNDRSGSWSCENALAEALTRRDFGEVAMHGHFSNISRITWKDGV
jgi:hypothetical protein